MKFLSVILLVTFSLTSFAKRGDNINDVPGPWAPRAKTVFKELDTKCSPDTSNRPDRGRFVQDNLEALTIREKMVSKAKCEILIEYYTVASDRISVAGLAALIDAAERGVKVRVIVDGLSHQIKDALIAATFSSEKAKENIKIRVFNPFKIWNPKTWYARLHDKAITVDGIQILSGGRNISNKYYGVGKSGFFDLDVYVEGQLAKRSRRYFHYLWNNDLVVDYKLGYYDSYLLNKCEHPAFKNERDCRKVSSKHIPAYNEYKALLKKASEKMKTAKDRYSVLQKGRDLLSQLLEEDGNISYYAQELSYIINQERKINKDLAVEINDKPIISQDDIDTHKAFESNGPITVFYDDPTIGKTQDGEGGIARQLQKFFKTRIEHGAKITVFSPYIVLTKEATTIIKTLIEEKDVKFKFYTNSSVSSDNVFAQAFYRHKLSRKFLLTLPNVEVFEFKGYVADKAVAEETGILYFDEKAAKEKLNRPTAHNRKGEVDSHSQNKSIIISDATTIHVKAAVIENPKKNPLILIGTFNLDIRSAKYNRELVALLDIKDAQYQVDKFKKLGKLIEENGFKAGLKKCTDEKNPECTWYIEYKKTPLLNRSLMKLFRFINWFDWLRPQA